MTDITNVDLGNLRNTQSNAVIHKETISNLLSQTDSILTDINNIVKCNDLSVATGRFQEDIKSISTKITENLDNLNTFLVGQINLYNETANKASSSIDALAALTSDYLNNSKGGV